MATPGNDSVIGTALDETFDLSAGGDDTLRAMGGDDTIYLGGALTGDDRIDGGGGRGDLALLDGDYSALVMQAETLVGVEELRLAAGHDYNISELRHGAWVNGSGL